MTAVGRRRGERTQGSGAVDAQVAGKRRGRSVADEVGEDPVGARVVEPERRRPGSVVVHRGMQVLEAGEVAARDDQVHALLVLDVEVADGLAASVDDAKAQLLSAAALELGGARARAGGRCRRRRARGPGRGSAAAVWPPPLCASLFMLVFCWSWVMSSPPWGSASMNWPAMNPAV